MVGNGQLYKLRTTPKIMSGSSILTPTSLHLTLGDGAASTELIARLVETTLTPSPHIRLLPNPQAPEHCKGVGRTDHHVNRPTSDAHIHLIYSSNEVHKGGDHDCQPSTVSLNTHWFQNETKIDEIKK